MFIVQHLHQSERRRRQARVQKLARRTKRRRKCPRTQRLLPSRADMTKLRLLLWTGVLVELVLVLVLLFLWFSKRIKLFALFSRPKISNCRRHHYIRHHSTTIIPCLTATVLVDFTAVAVIVLALTAATNSRLRCYLPRAQTHVSCLNTAHIRCPTSC